MKIELVSPFVNGNPSKPDNFYGEKLIKEEKTNKQVIKINATSKKLSENINPKPIIEEKTKKSEEISSDPYANILKDLK